MGYIMAGLPSRVGHLSHLKRQYKLRQPFYVEKKARKRAAHTKHHRRHRRKMTLEDLPVEVIRRIFVHTCGEPAMTMVNKHFHRSLETSNILLEKVFWERYTWEDERHILVTEQSDGNHELLRTQQFLVNRSLFKNMIMVNYMLHNYESLERKIAYFVDDHMMEYLQENELLDVKEIRDMHMRFSHREKFLANDIDTIDEPYATETKQQIGYRTDFPPIFYSQYKLYFEKHAIHSMKKMRKHFYIKRPYDLITSIIPWFFQIDDYHSNWKSLIKAVRTIMCLSNNDITLKDEIAMNSPLPLVYLITEITHASELEKRDLKRIKQFITKFYKDQEMLSNPELWSHIRDTANKDLTALIISMGGQPDLTFFT
ncbi:uncharacterized protein CGFF_03833 [Nakaseomyces glabratus]|nr:hypothetical protein J6894_03811 [Nakaseomyces glabratus]QNG15880.1 uncharacterized protein GWK60_K11099 [Nakaseomyces glabratus]SCV16272.1 uncharacterized protein CGFF_03833 [Nakaseomyces glabratus]SLM16070.1 uncharacterized protein CGFF_03833 [Nakaseomyces glabratus]